MNSFKTGDEVWTWDRFFNLTQIKVSSVQTDEDAWGYGVQVINGEFDSSNCFTDQTTARKMLKKFVKKEIEKVAKQSADQIKYLTKFL